ncbi:MAG: hypothetical protein ACRDRB_09615 [Pseudonocardiaceae bacterium]
MTSPLSVVGEQAVDGSLAVCLGGQTVAPCLVKAGVSEQLGDHDEVVALAYQAGPAAYLYSILNLVA